MSELSDFHLFNLEKQGICGTSPLINRHFGDIDELAVYVLEDVKMTQLRLQPFQCHSLGLFFKTISFNFTNLNCPVNIIGEKKQNFLCFVCLPYGIKRPIISHGLSITEDYIYGFDLNRGVDMIFPENTIHSSVYIRQDVFMACSEAMDRPDLNPKFFAPNYIYVPQNLPPLCTYLKQLYQLLKQESPLLQKPYFQQIILKDFLPLLITALPIQPTHLKIPISHFARFQLVKKAENYLQSHLDQPLTLTDLCQALETSSRTLSYAFQEIFSISPMAYLKILRLQGVNRALKANDPSVKTVTNLANQFGFWSLGHFSKDYQKLFREHPSETLARIK